MKNIKLITTCAIFIAISLSFDLIKEYYLPFLELKSGGSINISLIPIVIAAFILKKRYAILIAILEFVLSFIFMPQTVYIISFLQFSFDYIIPILAISYLPGLLKPLLSNTYFKIVFNNFICMFVRTLSLVFSGAIFWQNDAAVNSIQSWIYSISYNLPYCIFTFLILSLVVPIIICKIKPLIISYNK